jgi:hypothetical protein
MILPPDVGGSGRSPDWLKRKNPAYEAMKRKAEKGLGPVTDCYSKKLKRFAPALEAMRITTSPVLTVSSSGAFLRRPRRLWDTLDVDTDLRASRGPPVHARI